MKNLLLVILCVSVASCKSFKDYQNQSSKLLEGKSQKFTIENNQFIVRLYVNNKEGDFLFDTGAMVSAITNKDYINAFSLTKENYYTSAKIKGATGTTIQSNHFISDTIYSEIITGKKNIFRHIIIDGKKTNCSEKSASTDGIIGFDIFKNAGQPILLDFQNLKITVLSSNYQTNGYKKLDVKIPTQIGSKITFPLIVDGNKMEFLFDTGNNGGLIISNKDNKIDPKKMFVEFETLVGSVDKMSNEKIKIYKDVTLGYNRILDMQINISSFPKLITNTLGISFIKHFNWILDFKTGAMYMKQISEIDNAEQNSELTKFSLKSGVINGKLIIGFKNSSINTNLNIGDQIISINNQKITPENICEMQELLNKTPDWGTLNIDVLPFQKN